MILVDHAIYVWRGKVWCHMVSTEGPDELHEFAAKLGLKGSWAQAKSSVLHYDLTEAMRARAVAAGAVEVDARTQWAHAWRPPARVDDRIRRCRAQCPLPGMLPIA